MYSAATNIRYRREIILTADYQLSIPRKETEDMLTILTNDRIDPALPRKRSKIDRMSAQRIEGLFVILRSARWLRLRPEELNLEEFLISVGEKGHH